MSSNACLVIQKDGETSGEHKVSDGITIGRSDSNVICLNHRAVSRLHAYVRMSEKGLFIEKRSSFSPLKVNGADTDNSMLSPGDVIGIGPYLIYVRGESSRQTVNQMEPAPSLGEVSPEETTILPKGNDGPAGTVVVEGVNTSEGTESADGANSLEINLQAVTDSSAVPEGMVTQEEGVLSEASLEQDSLVSGDSRADSKTTVFSLKDVKAKLVFIEGTANVTEIEIEGNNPVTIGRSKQCDVIVEDKKASLLYKNKNHVAVFTNTQGKKDVLKIKR